jgi:potassium/hydrogen antiporter
VFVFQTFFFVYIGLSITLASTSVVIFGLLLVLVMLLMRLVVVRTVIGKRVPAIDSSLIAVMIPRGLATAVLGSLALQQGITGGLLIQELTYAVVLWSIVVTSLMVFLLEKTSLSSLSGRLLGGAAVAAPIVKENPLADAVPESDLPDSQPR